jgi:hypothetical protein
MFRIILFMAFMHQTGAFWRYSPWIMARASRGFSLFSEGCGDKDAELGHKIGTQPAEWRHDKIFAHYPDN